MNLIANLDWPIGVARKVRRKRGTFTAEGSPIGLPEAINKLSEELTRHDAKEAELYAEFLPTHSGRVTGTKWSGEDPGTVLRCIIGRTLFCLPCDTFDDLAQNIAAIANHLEAIRRITRYGVSSSVQMLQEFAQLPMADRSAPRSGTWWEVLGVSKECTRSDAENAYRFLAKTAHPDAGGSNEAMQRLNHAITTARKELG